VPEIPSILSLNSGSTSLKFGLFRAADCSPLLEGDVDWADGRRDHARLSTRPVGGKRTSIPVSVPDDRSAVRCALNAVLEYKVPDTQSAVRVIGAGHRVVHGGAEFRESTRITQQVKAAIASLSQLAPLHNPPALRAIEGAEELLKGVPQVAVFDTAFFANLPPKSYLYALPPEYFERFGIRRFGFHGISHAYCAQRAAEIVKRAPDSFRLINCHLGGGCSAAAVQHGRAVGSTLGFSPLDGLIMGSRPGSVDPGALIHLLRQPGMTLEKLDEDLNRNSGLRGISGISTDMAQIEAAADRGNARAQLAFDMFIERLITQIGGLAALMGGVDVLSFTDRIGEQSSRVRSAVCNRLGFLGLHLDEALNKKAPADSDLASPESHGRILAIHTREELMVAWETLRIVSGG
jgi:acetate kinase